VRWEALAALGIETSFTTCTIVLKVHQVLHAGSRTTPSSSFIMAARLPAVCLADFATIDALTCVHCGARRATLRGSLNQLCAPPPYCKTLEGGKASSHSFPGHPLGITNRLANNATTAKKIATTYYTIRKQVTLTSNTTVVVLPWDMNNALCGNWCSKHISLCDSLLHLGRYEILSFLNQTNVTDVGPS
jgi:hypothetical protein